MSLEPFGSLMHKVRNLGIRGRITLFYLTLLLFSLLCSGILYERIYSGIILNQVSSSSLETLDSVSSNIRSLFLLANNYSKLIVANPDVRSLLKSRKGYDDVEGVQKVSEFMETIMSSFVEVSSVYIVDNDGNRFFKDKIPDHFLSFNPSRESIWWKRASGLQGSSYVILKGGDAFLTPVRENFISHIRIINNIDDQKPIGAVIINISETLFRKAISDISKHYDTDMIILDEENNSIFSGNDNREIRIADLLSQAEGQKSWIMNSKEESKLYTYIEMEDFGWKIISVIPFVEVARESRIFFFVSSIILVVVAILIFVGSVLITRLYTEPVDRLVKVMADVGKGNFHTVEFHTAIDEFNRLRDGYNLMIGEIQGLLDRVVLEEKTKRKAEMNILQAQIKPHFLYNTFDSISSLALMGQSREVYEMVTALGSYYRISLSKGREVITVREEIEMVRNYLNILKVRYEDAFSVSFQEAPELADTRILKLVVQPFVENALYHGIRPKGEAGEIAIKTWKEEDRFKIMIRDDGVGISDEKQRELSEAIEDVSPSLSFGLAGTVKRLRLYYGRKDIFTLNSGRGRGCEIILSIPMPEGESEYEE